MKTIFSISSSILVFLGIEIVRKSIRKSSSRPFSFSSNELCFLQAARDWENRRREYEDEIHQLREQELKQKRVVEQLKKTYDVELTVRIFKFKRQSILFLSSAFKR